MVAIAPTKSGDNKIIRWVNVTENDTADPILIASGKHTERCEWAELHRKLETDKRSGRFSQAYIPGCSVSETIPGYSS